MRSAVPSLKFHRITSSRFNVNAGLEIPESISDRGIVFFFHIYEIRSLTRSAHPGLTRICLCFYYNERKRNAFLCRRICGSRGKMIFYSWVLRGGQRWKHKGKQPREEDKHFTHCLFIKTGCSLFQSHNTQTSFWSFHNSCVLERLAGKQRIDWTRLHKVFRCS